MIVGFDHIHIYCGDVEKAASFFRDILGGERDIPGEEAKLYNGPYGHSGCDHRLYGNSTG